MPDTGVSVDAPTVRETRASHVGELHVVATDARGRTLPVALRITQRQSDSIVVVRRIVAESPVELHDLRTGTYDLWLASIGYLPRTVPARVESDNYAL